MHEDQGSWGAMAPLQPYMYDPLISMTYRILPCERPVLLELFAEHKDVVTGSSNFKGSMYFPRIYKY
ncbi:hypothetical protein ACAM_1437 [Aeropyrum camini SY1 = JCM 12091]|uniref:Uncharacterized protein n=1 Tax=Aeropyrum camini SY1 = JCM 12091 TaxID=1198449 RepID=U3TEN1_9CREN|nr:hypothetical protein ACAM_1437 [Aeropyrum camini SY1 = JCM 12091]